MVEQPNLNMDAEWPGLEVVKGSPLHVEPVPENEQVTTSDYIPASGEKLPAQTRVVNFQRMPELVVDSSPGNEYVPAEVVQQRERDRKRWIIDKAKKIYSKSSDVREQFERAKRLVQDASPEQRAKPTVGLAEAMRLLELGVPMTKKQAYEAAESEARNKGPEDFSERLEES
jgi:hypothetical protein